MRTFLSILGIVASFFLLKYRQKTGDAIGEAEWMKKLGGVYMVVAIVAVLIFFWSVAELTGTTDIMFAPLRRLIPGTYQAAPVEPF